MIWKGLDWLYTPQCVSCGEKGTILCARCEKENERVVSPYCLKCGKPITAGKRCQLCRTSGFCFDVARACFIYSGPVAAGIKQLKYHQNLALSRYFGKEMAELYRGLCWESDLLIPVPLSKERKRERGFNQSEWIAHALGKEISVPVSETSLFKIRHTETQVHLSGDDRRKNLKGVFLAEPVLVRGKSLLLIDDVMTTGTTFNECAAALLEAGAREVRCLSIATADLKSAVSKGKIQGEYAADSNFQEDQYGRKN